MRAAGFGAVGRQAGQLGAIEAAGVGQGPLQSFQPDRLEQVGHRVGIEGFQRVFAVGRDKDDGGRLGQCCEPARGLQTVQSGHLDVQQHDVRWRALRQPERFRAVAGFATGLMVRQPVEQIAQPVAGGWFHHLTINTFILNAKSGLLLDKWLSK
ncbi:MAG: hypothetical protein MZW92_55060 [Comamonadaceae bacterium]|nr:hypothetical protein [Comamonadaceae bacterium]